jgi:hypothetical protein
MKVRATTNLSKYGFKQDQFGMWYFYIDDLTGKGVDSHTPLQVMICIFSDRTICMNMNNDHVPFNYEDADVAYRFEETFDLPDVILNLIKNDEIESPPESA